MARPRKYPPTHELAETIEAILWRHGNMTIGDLTDEVARRTKQDVPTHNVRQAIHHHRNRLSNETGALIVRTIGPSWTYEMTNEAEAITEWLAMRERAVETQLKTMLAQAQTSARISPANSTARRRANVERKLIGRLVEDIAELKEVVA